MTVATQSRHTPPTGIAGSVPAAAGDSPAQQEYSNKLEQWYSSCPGPVQTVLNVGNAYKTVDGWLKHVAGDPEKIASYGPRYVALGAELDTIAAEVSDTSRAITGWSGPAYESFMAKTGDFADKIAQVAKSVAGTQEILVAAAKGAVQVANCICDLVMMFVKFLVKSFLAALASSTFTFGGSIAAWLSANIAKAVQMVQKVMSAIGKLGELISKITALLKKVMEVVQKIQKVIALIKGVFAAFKAFKDGDVMGGVQALAGVAQGYTSLTGGHGGGALAGAQGTLGTVTGVAGQVQQVTSGSWGQAAGALYDLVAGKPEGNGHHSAGAEGGPAGGAGGAAGSGGLAGLASTSNAQIVKQGVQDVATDAQGAWDAIKEAREAAARNAPPKI